MRIRTGTMLAARMDRLLRLALVTHGYPPSQLERSREVSIPFSVSETGQALIRPTQDIVEPEDQPS